MAIDSSSLTIREIAHYNGGKAFFAYGYECVQYPQLTLFKRFDRKTKQVTNTWRVNGADQPDIDAAIRVLEAECAQPLDPGSLTVNL